MERLIAPLPGTHPPGELILDLPVQLRGNFTHMSRRGGIALRRE